MASERHRSREVARERARPLGRFTAAQRVKKRREFQSIQSQGRRVVTPHFVLLVYAREPSERSASPTSVAPLCAPSPQLPARLGITASRKLGAAPLRSRAKRLVREAFRATRDLWEPGIDLVVIVRAPWTALKLDDVVAEWRAAAQQIARWSQVARRDRHGRARSVEAGRAPP